MLLSYTLVDNHIFETNISPYAKLIYVALCKYANQDGICFPSLKTLSQVTGIKSKHTIIKAINELLQYGMIEVKKNKYHSNIYQIKSKYYSNIANKYVVHEIH